MALAIGLIIFKGTSEGQASVFNNFLSHYIEETAAAVKIDTPQQLADINSVFAYTTSSNKAPKTSVLSTIQDNSVVSPGTILNSLLDEFSDRGTEVATYEVQEGDTLSFIASDFGVHVDTIISANNLRDADDIQPGAMLRIPPIDGLIHKVKTGDTVASLAKRYSAEEEKIINFNSLPRDGQLVIDTEIIVPGGKLPAPAAPNLARNTSTQARRFAYLPNLSSFFSLPTLGFNWGRIHGRNGVDIANACGTGIYAAAGGKITLAKSSGWNGGFGKFIKVVHPNGTETLYAHLSKLLVTVGETIQKSQQIGLMGTTGRSTGCHLHFEVHGAKNPLAKY